MPTLLSLIYSIVGTLEETPASPKIIFKSTQDLPECALKC